jgi:hypothetical protein
MDENIVSRAGRVLESDLVLPVKFPQKWPDSVGLAPTAGVWDLELVRSGCASRSTEAM